MKAKQHRRDRRKRNGSDTSVQPRDRRMMRRVLLSVVALILAGVFAWLGILHLAGRRPAGGAQASRVNPLPNPCQIDTGGPVKHGADTARDEQQAVSPPGRPDAAALKQETLDVAGKVIADFPDQPDALGLMGVACSKLGQQAEAITWYRRALDLNPRLAEAHYRMGEAYRGRGEFGPAADCYRAALAIYPELRDAHRKLGLTLLDLGRHQEAVAVLKPRLEHRPEAAEIESLLGQAYLQTKQYEAAVRHLERAARRLPDDDQLHYALATAYARSGQGKKAGEASRKFRQLVAAREQAKRARKDDEDLLIMSAIAAEIHAAAGQVYAQRGRQQRAEEHWRRAAVLDPDNPLCRQLLAEAYMRRKQWPEALEMCSDLVRIAPDNPVHHLNAGVALASMFRMEESEKALRQALLRDPGMIETYHALLQVLMHRDRKLHEAKAVARELVLLAPQPENYLLLANLCRQTGDRAGEQAAMEQARKRAP